MSEQSVTPRYGVGEIITYRDRHDRQQSGEVVGIEAHWRRRSGKTPLVIYTIKHPTYAGRSAKRIEAHVVLEHIFGLSNGGRP